MHNQIYPAEFVLPGHPDKLCDAIADSLVERAYQLDPRALVGVEVAIHRDHVFVTGRIGCKNAKRINLKKIVTEIYRDAGYVDDWYPAPSQIKIIKNLCVGPLEEGEAEFRELADDQAICVGYANDLEATNHLPVEHWLVGRLARRLSKLRGEIPEIGLGPDGKVLIILQEYSGTEDSAWQLAGFSCSLQQKTTSDEVALHRAVRTLLEDELRQASEQLPSMSSELPDQLTVNGAGTFEVGGPEGDNGLSGKKLVADAYGPRVPIGGGAWSGKDFFKVDRAGAMHARRVARCIVELGLAKEATVYLGWFPGDRSARLLQVLKEDGKTLALPRLARLFDMSLRHSGTEFLPVGGLVDIARWGHFSTDDLPWEKIKPM